MKNLFFESLQKRLIILILIAVIPGLILILYTGIERRNHARSDALEQALRLAKNARMLQEHKINEARNILFTLSQLPYVSIKDKTNCDKIFANLLKRSEGYSSFGLVLPDGEVFASAPSIAKPVNFSDRPWFQRALQNRQFVIGEYLKGRISGRPLFPVALPVLEEKGRLKAVLYAGIDLFWFNQLYSKNYLPREASLNVVDRDGTILVRFPKQEKFIGQDLAKEPIIRQMLIQKEGMTATVGLNGLTRFFGFTSLGQGEEAIYTSVGIPKKVALAEANQTMIHDFFWLAVIILSALLMAWLFGRFFIINPTNRLLRITHQLTEGDLSVRTGAHFDRGEIGQLAHAFDQMAESLQIREEEGQARERAIRESENRYRLLAENVIDVIWTLDMNLKYTFLTPSTIQLTGYSVEEMMGQTMDQSLSPSSYQIAMKVLSEELAIEAMEDKDLLRTRTLELELNCKDGSTVWVEVKVSFLRNSLSQPMGILGISRDISSRRKADQALRLSEEKLSKAFRSSPDWMTISTLEEGRYIEVNDAFVELSGFSREEALGKTTFELGIWIDPQDRDRAVEIIGKEGFLKNYETKVRMKSGEVRTTLWSVETFDFEGQKCLITTNRDITEQRQAQDMLRQTMENLRLALGGTIEALAMTSEIRDPYTAGHQRRVADLARAIAQEMNLPENKVNGLRMAGSIHDLGKISVPAEILSKPTQLSDLEFGLIKTHSQVGYEVLKDIEFPWPIARIILEHHERMNGSGYPNGLTGDQLLLETKILIVADVVEAIASYRPYRPALGIEVALEEIEKNKGILYDVEAVDVCLRLFREKGYSFN